MARTLHADGKTGKVYIYNNDADPATYESPASNQLGDLHFHSDLSYLGNAHVLDVTITHPQRTRSSSTSKGLFRSTRKLNARSYLDWGIPVDLADAQEGDVVIFSRGDPSGWQGHVGFFVDTVGASIEVLGGNQADAVNVKRYSKARLLGVRRAGNVAPAVTMGVGEVQTRLRELGYHEVGAADGDLGPRTRAAILAFRDDNALRLVPFIDVALVDALIDARPRGVPQARAAGAPVESRIVTAANAQIGLGVMGAVGTVGSQVAPAVAEAENARAFAERAFAILGLDGWLSAALPWIGVAVFVGVIVYAVKARKARIEDHRTGKTP